VATRDRYRLPGAARRQPAGWHIAPQHFAERHGLVILIALGESVIAIGGGISTALDAGTITAATLGIATVSALWWLYFDVAAIFARRRLSQLTGEQRTRLALHAYSDLHLPMVAGIVVFAFGLETSLHHLHDPLPTLPAAALLGGVALYLLAHVAFLFTAIHRIFRRRTAAAIVLAALIPLARTIPAITAVALVTAVCAALVAYEAIARRDYRQQLRHADAAP
jgi:low temperature requirement protein LtrA